MLKEALNLIAEKAFDQNIKDTVARLGGDIKKLKSTATKEQLRKSLNRIVSAVEKTFNDPESRSYFNQEWKQEIKALERQYKKEYDRQKGEYDSREAYDENDPKHPDYKDRMESVQSSGKQITACVKMTPVNEERELPNNTRGKKSQALELQKVIRGLESILTDMKDVEQKDYSRSEMASLHYEQQSDLLIGYSNQLRTIAGAKQIKESVESSTKFKVGGKVIAKAGPHKGQTHTIIHIFDDGSMNIKPTGLHARDIKYRLGAVKAKPDQVEPTNSK